MQELKIGDTIQLKPKYTNHDTAIYVVVKITKKYVYYYDITKSAKEVHRGSKADFERIELVELCAENAPKTGIIFNKKNPEWGFFRFKYDTSPDKLHCYGKSVTDTCLFENSFSLWYAVR